LAWMLVTVKYLAGIKDVTGKAEETVELEEDTVGALLEKLTAFYGYPLARLFVADAQGDWHSLVLVGDRILFPSAVETKIKRGEIVAIMPPLAGG